MTRKHTGNRSRYSMLPFAVRYQIATMLHDGATAKSVLETPEICAAAKKLGLELTVSAISKVRNTAEYGEIVSQRKKIQDSYSENRLAAALLQDYEAAAAIAEQLKISLLQLVRQCVEAKPDDPRELERLVRAAVRLSNSTKDSRISNLKLKLSAMHQENQQLRSEIAAIQAEPKAPYGPPDPVAVADTLSQILGVRRNPSAPDPAFDGPASSDHAQTNSTIIK